MKKDLCILFSVVKRSLHLHYFNSHVEIFHLLHCSLLQIVWFEKERPRRKKLEI